MNDFPIAVVDSGVGGLGVYKWCLKLMPFEDIIYVMDNLHSPYGTKSICEIKNHVFKIARYLIEQKKAKIIVFACNTATAVAIKEIRSFFHIPIIGMEPAIKPAIKEKYKNIVVLATKPTIRVCKIIKNYKKKYNVKTVGFTNLALLIEKNLFNLDNLIDYLEKNIKQNIKKNCDAVVLGCSHFIIIKKQLSQIFEKNVVFFDSDFAVAKRVRDVMIDENINCSNIIKKSNYKIYMTKFDSRLLKNIETMYFS